MPPIGKSELRINNNVDYNNDPSSLAAMSSVTIQNNHNYENQMSSMKIHYGIAGEGDFSQSSNYDSFKMKAPLPKQTGINSPEYKMKKQREKQNEAV